MPACHGDFNCKSNVVVEPTRIPCTTLSQQENASRNVTTLQIQLKYEILKILQKDPKLSALRSRKLESRGTVKISVVTPRYIICTSGVSLFEKKNHTLSENVKTVGNLPESSSLQYAFELVSRKPSRVQYFSLIW